MSSDLTQTRVSTDELLQLRARAETGDVNAQHELGLSYATGRRVPEDYLQAVTWFRVAAEQGHPSAQHRLGVAYAFGQGVPRDDVQAHMWIDLAASRASGENRAAYAKSRDVLAARMTLEQRAEARTLAREWSAAFELRRKE